MIHVRRDQLVRMLLAHGEDDLVERVPSLPDAELKRIGERGDYYAFSSEHAVRHGSMGTSRALSLAAVDVMEDAPRELRQKEGQRRGPSAEEEALRRLNLCSPG